MKLKVDFPPKTKEEERKPFEQIEPDKEKLKYFFITDFKDKSLISSPERDEVLLLDTQNKKIKDLLVQYQLASNGIWENDSEKMEYSAKIEEELYLLGRPIKKSDFIHVKDITDSDIDLFNKVFGSHEIDFRLSSWEISIDEAVVFLRYTKDSNQEDFDRILKYKEKFGVTPFLSLIHGGKEMGDKILELGEKLEPEVAKKVFAKYGEIIDTAESAGRNLAEMLPANAKNTGDLDKEIEDIKKSLLLRAKDLLVAFHDKKYAHSDELLKDLERYQSEILLYADTYKKLNQSGKEVRLEDIKGTNINILSQEEKEKVAEKFWDITKANRPFIKDSEKLEKRKKEFTESIQNKDSNFYVLKHNDSIIAFCSFTPDQDGNLYAESLNVETEAKGAQIGSEFFPAVLEKVKKMGKDIYGYVHAGNKNILPYYERLGFEVKEIQKDGELKYEIRIPAGKKEQDFKMAA